MSVVPRDFMKFAALPSFLLYLSIPLILLSWGMVFFSSSSILWASVSLTLLLQWIRKSRVSLVLLLKFLLDFESIPIGRSK